MRTTVKIAKIQREEHGTTHRSSGSPSWIPIFTSVVALIISGLSLWESHRNRKINEELNRPVLSVAFRDVRSTWSESVYIGDVIGIEIFTSLKNAGKATATVSRAEINPNFKNPSGDCRLLSSNPSASRRGFEVLAGQDTEISGNLSVTPACEKSPVLNFELNIKVDYTDDSSGKQYSQSFVEKVDLSPGYQKIRKDL